MGSRGEIIGKLEDNAIYVIDFLTGKREKVPVEVIKEGHGGGDMGIMESFVQMVENGDTGNDFSNVASAVKSHYMAFAAEKSRIEKQVISFGKEKEL